jgi:acetyl-CoA acyltransferase
VIVAGGTESMSLVPMGGHKIAPNPTLIDRYPDVYLSTGLVAENHARESGISRAEQDAFALRSHQRAVAAIDAGRFAHEIVPVTTTLIEEVRLKADPTYERADPTYGGATYGGTAVAVAPRTRQVTFSVDEGPRRDTSAEALAKLRPAFHAAGSVTAGNSSDQRRRRGGHRHIGRACESRRADADGRFICSRPPVSTRTVRDRPIAGDSQGAEADRTDHRSIDLVELSEAFAAQVLACLKSCRRSDRLNVNGGAIALGHPLRHRRRSWRRRCYEMKRRNARYGMVTMCVGGRMGRWYLLRGFDYADNR